jgi:hypothetical protein
MEHMRRVAFETVLRACAAVLQETYLTFARWAAGVAAVMGLLALLFSFAAR